MTNKEALKKRWDSLNITTEVLKAAAPQYQDPKVYFEELILKEKNYDLASKRITILETLLIQDKEQLLEIEIDKIRVKRDELLRLSDFSQLPDAPFSSEKKKQYREYRQYLRDLPSLHRHQQLTAGPVDFNTYLTWKEKTKYA